MSRAIAQAGTAIGATRMVAFGKYELFARLGRGGMADVFLAVARGMMGFNKLVVIKRLHEASGDQGTMVEMFLDEARLAARLQHPNIVHTYEVGSQDEDYFIAMEYLEGQPLHKVARSTVARELITHVMWCHIIADALAGLHHAHELCDYDGKPLEIVHRDISPHNIFLTYSGNVKVVDFGIAKASVNTSETAAGVLKGKVNYMPPEQVIGDTDRRSDIYSMGLTLWEVLAGKAAYRGEAVKVLHQILHDPVPSIGEACPELDSRIIAIVDRATHKDREQRYQSADEFREALLSYIRETGEVIREAEIGKILSSAFQEIREKVSEQVKQHMADLRTEPSSVPTFSHTTATLPSLVESPTGTVTPPSNQGAIDPHTAILSNTQLSEPQPRGRKFGGILVGLAALGILIAVAAWGRPFTAAGSPTATEAPPAPRGRVGAFIESEPSEALIELGERVIGRTPTTVDLDPGSYTIVLTKDGYDPQSVEIQLSPGGPIERRSVFLHAKPSAKQIASAVSAIPLQPTSLPTRSTVSQPRPAQPTVRHAPASTSTTTLSSSATATPEKGGFLSLNTFPWSRVSEGGRPLGTTPLYRVPMSAGTHVVVLENPDDGIRTTYTVTIKPGESTSRSVELK